MTDILDRLELEQTRSGMWADTCILLEEAAQEIRKLTIERDEWREACIAHGEKAERAEREKAEAVAAEREQCAKLVEQIAVAQGSQECCGCGVGSPPECCGDPLYMISDRHAAAAIRARSQS